MRHVAMSSLMALCAMLPVACCAHVFTVDCMGGSDYLTIQEAVSAASEGDTIIVAPCVYEEQVVIPDLSLVIAGAGSAVTEVAWSGSGATVEFAGSALTISGLMVRHTSDTGVAILWDDGPLFIEDCSVVGRVGGSGHGNCWVEVRRCVVTLLSVQGGFRTSTVEDSHFGRAEFHAFWETAHVLISSGSSYGTLVASHAHCYADSIGYIQLRGGPDSYDDMQADASRIDSCVARFSPAIDWDGCQIGTLTYGVDSYGWPYLEMTGCLVTGGLAVQETYRASYDGVEPSSDLDRQEGYCIEHNTVLGAFTFEPEDCPREERYIRSNIVMGLSMITCSHDLILTHNDFAGGLELAAPSAHVSDNISEDPQFCNAASGDYTIHESSPCNGTAHDGSAIGAFGVGCGTAVQATSWGAIKGLFR